MVQFRNIVTMDNYEYRMVLFPMTLSGPSRSQHSSMSYDYKNGARQSYTYTMSQKTAFLFLSELRKISMNFNKFWQVDGKMLKLYAIYTLCFKKTCDHVFDDKLKQNCPFRKIFGTLITKSTGHRQLFLFFHLTYFVQLLYLGKLSRPKYQQKLNKIMKISQEDVILIKTTGYISAKGVWCTKAVE